MLPILSFSQCKKHFIQDESLTTEGIINGIDHYYQNLIIQDIALANRQPFSEISLRFEFKVHYLTDHCSAGKVELSVLPISVKCLPLFYQGFDIAPSVKPEKADLVFYVFQDDGIISDSLIFFDIPVSKDSSLYNSLTLAGSDVNPSLSVSFSRSVFHFTKSSYEIFRDRILEIDQYFAASLIADSTLTWAKSGFLSENNNRVGMILQQIELERIINYINPGQFKSVFISEENDIYKLSDKYKELLKLNTRMKAIIDYNHFDPETIGDSINESELINKYLDWFDHYHVLAFKSDFRFVNFIEGLSRPDFSRAGQFLSPVLVQGLIDRGRSFEMKGNQIRALTYYESANKYAELLNLHDYQAMANQLLGRMKNDISTSYLEISRKSALTENPAMAVQYFNDAQHLFVDEEEQDLEPAWLKNYEEWLFNNFESQVVKFIDLKKYRKAFIYLNEIESHCLTAESYPCPDPFHEWMRVVRDGIYHDLLKNAGNLFANDEWSEAEQIYGQAVAIRLQAGYRIDKDIQETKLEVRFRQIHYENLIEEGQRYFNAAEYSSALYYFNKAYFLEKFSLIHPNPGLFTYRQDAARQVILQKLSDGRLKAWAYDFEGAGVVLTQVRSMLSDYEIAESDSLTMQYFALEDEVDRNECELILRSYKGLMKQADSARVEQDFILARKMTGDAVNLSMSHLDCRIRDDEAWYQKVLLEAPADFQRMEKELDGMTEGSYSDYLKSFQDLKKYYYRHKLLDQGIVFVPLFDRVIKTQDSVFLAGMLNNYIMLNDFDHAYRLLERMRELGLPSHPLAEEQKSVAEPLARRDAKNPDLDKPWNTLESYTDRDKWYRAFKWKYKFTWLKATKWKLRYWPFIWKK